MRKLFVLAVAAALLVAFALPAGAGDWSFFGRVHVETYWKDTDNPDTVADTTDLTWRTSDWTNFGANIKVTDKIDGMFEIRSKGTGGAPGEFHSDLTSNAWWGTYAMGPGKLRVGRWWAPTFHPPPVWMLDTVGSPIISVMESGLRYEFPAGPAFIELAGFTPRKGGGLGAYTNNTEATIPRLEAQGSFTFGGVGLKLYGMMDSYDAYDGTTTSAQSMSFDSQGYGAIVSWGMGPIVLQGSYQITTSPYSLVGTNLYESETEAMQLQFTYKMPKVTFNVVYGTEETTNDTPASQASDPRNGLTFSAPIQIAQNFIMRPEISMIDEEDCKDDAGAVSQEEEVLEYGVKWEINF